MYRGMPYVEGFLINEGTWRFHKVLHKGLLLVKTQRRFVWDTTCNTLVLCSAMPSCWTGKSSQVILLSGKCCGVYRKGLSIPIQNNHFPLKFCHISCSHSSQSTRIWHENYVKTKYKALYGMTYLSEYGHFGCFNSMGRSIDTLMIHLNFMQEMWIFSDYLKLMLLEYDGYIYNIVDVKSI